MGISAGELATASDVQRQPIFSAASTIKLASASSLGSTTASTYTLFKDIIVPGGGSFRIMFDLSTSYTSTDVAWGRVYRNGSAIGTEQSETSSTWVTKSEDISGWYPGDSCQLYIKRSTAIGAISFRDFFLYASTNKSDFQVKLNATS